MIEASSNAWSRLSLHVSRKTYVPLAGNVAVVDGEAALAKTACPGPLVVDQPQVTTAGGLGNPSSVTVPASETPEGSVIDLLEPALTTGAAFAPNEA